MFRYILLLLCSNIIEKLINHQPWSQKQSSPFADKVERRRITLFENKIIVCDVLTPVLSIKYIVTQRRHIILLYCSMSRFTRRGVCPQPQMFLVPPEVPQDFWSSETLRFLRFRRCCCPELRDLNIFQQEKKTCRLFFDTYYSARYIYMIYMYIIYIKQLK